MTTYDPYGIEYFNGTNISNLNYVSSFINYPYAIDSNEIILYSYSYGIYGFDFQSDMMYIN